MSYDHDNANETSKTIMLDLSTQKADNIFVSDQTPTPTRLIKNCEEVGLFEDLSHVNPFEETFRRAVEQNAGSASSSKADESASTVEDTLHTPQVFPQLSTSAERNFQNCNLIEKPLDRIISVDDLLTDGNSIFRVTATRQNSASSIASLTTVLQAEKTNKYRPIAEKPPAIAESNLSTVQHPVVQIIQPQLITWSLDGQNNDLNSSNGNPYILPKTSLNTKTKSPATPTEYPIYVTNEPSSASMTPTSQLPIKERLKAILSNHSKVQQIQKKTKQTKHFSKTTKAQTRCEEDCLERKRAAASRYRNKIRNEFKELRQRNNDLAAENAKLRKCITELSEELSKRVIASPQQPPPVLISNSTNVPHQVQLPASTLQLVMSIPSIIVPSSGQPTLLQPITYSVEKK